VVIQRIDKDRVSGYLSAPKHTRAQLASTTPQE
jgi:hypothetical protein